MDDHDNHDNYNVIVKRVGWGGDEDFIRQVRKLVQKDSLCVNGRRVNRIDRRYIRRNYMFRFGGFSGEGFLGIDVFRYIFRCFKKIDRFRKERHTIYVLYRGGWANGEDMIDIFVMSVPGEVEKNCDGVQLFPSQFFPVDFNMCRTEKDMLKIQAVGKIITD